MPIYSNIQDFSIQVGAVDVTEYVKSFSFRYPMVDFDNPLILTGQIVLRPTRTGTLNLDEESEPLWARGENQVSLQIRGSNVLAGRIANAFYDDAIKELRLDITDKLGLVWGNKNAGIPPVSRALTEPKKVKEIVRELIEYGSQIDGITTLQFIGNMEGEGEQELPIYPQAFQGGALKLAQTIASERGYWLWCDTTEQIKAIPYRTQLGKSYQISERKLIGYQRYKASSETPADVIKVVGSYEDKLKCSDNQITVTEEFDADENGQKILIRRTTEQISKSKFRETITTDISTAFNVAFDDLPEELAGRTSLVPTSTETTIRSYNKTEGRLTRVFGNSLTANGLYKPLRTILDVGQWYQLGVQKTYSEQYSFDKVSGVLVEKNIEEKLDKIGLITISPEQYGSINGLVTRVLQNETWQDSVCNKFVYKIKRYERKPSKTAVLRGLSQVLGQRQNNVDPPTGDVNDPEQARETKIIEEKVRVGEGGGTPKTEEVIEAKTVLDKGALAALGRLYGDIQRQRQKARAIAHEPVKYVIENFEPFMGATVKDGFYIVDAPTFTAENGKLTFGFIGNRVGAAVSGFEPALRPYTPTAGLQVAPINDVAAFVGVAIDPIVVGAQRGTPPYTFDVTGLPAGLTFAGGLISGAPTTAGSYSVTVEVEDSVLTTDSTVFTIDVAGLEPIPSYEFYIQWDLVQASLIDADVDDIVPLPDTTLGGIQEQGGQIVPGANLNWFAQTEPSWNALEEENWNAIEE